MGLRSTVVMTVAIGLLAGPGTVIAEVARAAPLAPVEFSGHVGCGPPIRPDSEERLEVGEDGLVLTRYRQGAWRQAASVSDPRLEAHWYHTFESTSTRCPGPGPAPASSRRPCGS
jgi:hypothetical protein